MSDSGCAAELAPGNVLKIGSIEFEATGDRILILEDEFRSGYECLVCLGRQFIQCDQCGGSGKSRLNEVVRCSRCSGNKRIKCPECSGKGVEDGGLVIPEASERRPTTGRIVSIGPRVKELRVGESVIYPDYVGHVYDIGQGTYDADGHEVMAVIRIMTESEVLSRVRGHLELRRIKRSVAVHVSE